MAPEDEIVEVVKRTIVTKYVKYETYQIQSFPELYVSRVPNSYSISLKDEFLYDERCIEKFENLREIFEIKIIELRNLILERMYSVILVINGNVTINTIHYHDCVFTSRKTKIDSACHNCTYYNEDNK